jgi:hypothetical protein
MTPELGEAKTRQEGEETMIYRKEVAERIEGREKL